MPRQHTATVAVNSVNRDVTGYIQCCNSCFLSSFGPVSPLVSAISGSAVSIATVELLQQLNCQQYTIIVTSLDRVTINSVNSAPN